MLYNFLRCLCRVLELFSLSITEWSKEATKVASLFVVFHVCLPRHYPLLIVLLNRPNENTVSMCRYVLGVQAAMS